MRKKEKTVIVKQVMSLLKAKNILSMLVSTFLMWG